MPHSTASWLRIRVRMSRQVTQTGMTLFELMLVLAIFGLIVIIAVPSYTQYLDRANNGAAAADITSIAVAIDRYYVEKDQYPDTLAETGLNNLRDPWGNPYQYLRIDGAGLKGKGSLRKDKKLNPVNSDYDLYSMGKDEQSKLPFTAKVSFDDVVRASNGRFIGLAADF